MNNTRRITIAAAFCTALCALPAASAAPDLQSSDWPQWRGPNRDAKAAGFNAPATWPKSLVQKWKVPVGLGDASPALVGDRLYVFARQGGDEVTLCLDAADASKELWRNANPVPEIGGPAGGEHAGPRSSPVVAEGKVVTLGVTGTLTCLDAATGHLLWRKADIKAVPRFYTSASPMILNGMVIAQLGSETSGEVAAFDLATGHERWKWTGDGPGYASPVLLKTGGAGGIEQVVTLTARNLVGLAASDGKQLWEIPCVPQGRAYNAATPLVDGQTVIYGSASAPGGQGMKAVKIEKQGDAFTTKELWSNPKIGLIFSTPVLKDGLIYGLSDKGVLFCLSAKDGQTLWTQPNPDSRKSFGPMIDAGAVLMALPDDSELRVFKPSAKGYEQLARIKVADTPTYAYPVVAGNRIYIKDQQYLTLWTVE